MCLFCPQMLYWYSDLLFDIGSEFSLLSSSLLKDWVDQNDWEGINQVKDVSGWEARGIVGKRSILGRKGIEDFM